jgi:hypothetical protein
VPPPARAGRIGAVIPPRQVTAAASRSIPKRSLLNNPPAAVGAWVLQRVGAENSVTSCDLQILVYDAAEAVSS